MSTQTKKPIAIIVVVLLLCASVAAWLMFKPRGAKTPNAAPTAVLRLDALDETNRVATLSDGGSRDPDGTLQSWRIDWGDGKEDNLSSIPQKATHTYASEGRYTISLWCADNLGATNSVPAVTNITFDFLKRQKEAEMAQAEAKRAADARLEAERLKQQQAQQEAERLKQEQAKNEAERLEQERQKQRELAAATEAQRLREQQELEQKRKAEAEAARTAQLAATPPPIPLAAGLADIRSTTVSYTPQGSSLGDFEIYKEKTEGKADNGNVLVILSTRCVNFPETSIPTANWQIDDKQVPIQAGRIRASLSPGQHQVKALFTPKIGQQSKEINADVRVQPNGDCAVIPRK